MWQETGSVCASPLIFLLLIKPPGFKIKETPPPWPYLILITFWKASPPNTVGEMKLLPSYYFPKPSKLQRRNPWRPLSNHIQTTAISTGCICWTSVFPGCQRSITTLDATATRDVTDSTHPACAKASPASADSVCYWWAPAATFAFAGLVLRLEDKNAEAL